MTLFIFLRTVSGRWKLVVGTAVIVAMLAVAFVQVLPVKYDASMDLSILRVNREETADYQYDGYYAIQASDLFSETIISWLQTPSVVGKIYDESGVTQSTTGVSLFTGKFRAKKLSSQNISVRFSANTEDEAKKLAEALGSVVNQKAESSLQTSKSKPLFEIRPSDPVVGIRQYDPLITFAAGFATGLLLGVLWVLGARYMKEEKISS